MVTIETIYLGELRTKAIHIQSGNELITDAPVDNQGKGEAFSPTDLLAASLGSCMLTVMGIAARNHDFKIEGTKMEIVKVMDPSPRRVCEIKINFSMPQLPYTDIQKKILIKAAKTCPVALSLHPDLVQNVNFQWLG